jgi:hypothetical protein
MRFESMPPVTDMGRKALDRGEFSPKDRLAENSTNHYNRKEKLFK